MLLPKQPDQHAIAAAYRHWLKKLPDVTGKSLTAMAKEIGVAVSTLTRPLKPDDPGISTPHQRTIEKLVEHYGIEPPSFIVVPTRRGALKPIIEDAILYRPLEADPVANALKALSMGRNDIDAWKIMSRALETAGYLPGDIVLVDHSREPKFGDPVCAEINYDNQRGAGDTVVRIFERAGPVSLLMPATMDAALRAPVAIDDRVHVHGVIIGMLRPLPYAA